MISEILKAYLRERNSIVLSYASAEDLRLIKVIRKEIEMQLSDHEAMQLISAVRATRKIPGDIADVGTYRGASSKLIADGRGESAKKIYLFDTFEGLPGKADVSDTGHKEGLYTANYREVEKYLSSYPNIQLYPGLFPETARPIENHTFSFVHLDVDLYQSTKDGLEFFYPRMTQGGVIMSHDYMEVGWGARKAIDEFMNDKPEAVFQSSHNQCLIVKI